MRHLLALMLVLLMAVVAHSEFQQANLSVNVQVNPDGTAYVTETVRLQMDSGSPVIYDTTMAASDLSTWRTKTKLDLRFHFNRDVVDITDVNILAEPRDSCSGCVRDVCTVCYGTLMLTYKVSPIANQSESGLFKMARFKPRTTNYSVNPDAFSFESSGAGSVVLPENTQLTILLPEGAFNESVTHSPEITTQGNRKAFTWRGRIPFNTFKLSFYTEEPLSTEVMEFFGSVRDDVLRVLFSTEGIAVVFMAVIAIASIVLLKRQETP